MVERLDADDVDGVVASYESDAVLASSDGTVARGHAQIREVYRRIVADRPVVPSDAP